MGMCVFVFAKLIHLSSIHEQSFLVPSPTVTVLSGDIFLDAVVVVVYIKIVIAVRVLNGIGDGVDDFLYDIFVLVVVDAVALVVLDVFVFVVYFDKHMY